jgi:superfamily II DNA or RNA helicase
MIDINKIVISEDITLREYQKKSKEKIYSLWQNHQSVMLQMPTGTGKTRIFASIVKDLHNTGANLGIAIKVLLLAHRDELIEQISENLGRRYNVRHGIIKSSLSEEPHIPTQIASILTLVRRLERWSQKQFDVIIIDEAHHAIADSYIKICKTFPLAKILGVTATPYRLSGVGFKSVFEQIIISPSVHDFIGMGFLCDYDYYSVRPTSEIQQMVDSIKEFSFDGDYAEKSLTQFFDNAKIRANLLETYRKYANGKKGIIYTININHNNHVCNLLNQNGIKAKAVDSYTKSTVRKEIVTDFRNGNIDIICNVNIFSEGFDCPDVEFIQLARPTKSFALYLQQVGRGFRKIDDKAKVIILDNVGLYNKFGLPSEEIDWIRYFEGTTGFEVRTNSISKSSKEVHFIDEGNEPVDLIYTTTSYERVSDYFEIEEDFPLITLKESVNKISKWYWYSDLAPLEYAEVINIHGELDEDDDELVFYNHLRKICQEGKWGVYDSDQNKILIEPEFDEIIEGDIHGRAMVRRNGKFGLISPKTGDIIISTVYDEIEKFPYSDYIDKFIVRSDEKFGVIGKGDEILIPIEYVEVFLSDNREYFFALNTDCWLIFDRKFKIIETESLKRGRLFFNRYYAVYKNDSYGFIDAEDQKMIIPLICEKKMEIYHDNFLMVRSNGMVGLLDNNFEWILFPNTQSIEFLTKDKLKVKRDRNFGILRTNGEILLPIRYSSCDLLDDAFIVYEKDKWKIIFDGMEVYSSRRKGPVLNWYNQNIKKGKNQKTKKPNNEKRRRVITKQLDPINTDLTDTDIPEEMEEVFPVVNKKKIIEYLNDIKEDNKNGFRLYAVARDFKYSMERIIEILKDYDFEIPNNPNYKLSPKEYELIKIIKESESLRSNTFLL